MYDIKYIFVNIIILGEIMNEIISFFKDIFMLNDTDTKIKTGLSQFKHETKAEKPVKKVTKIQKEVKLSDLMRRSA